MQTLLAKTQAYKLVKTESGEGRLSHAYLLLYDDARNLSFAMRAFAKILFGCDTPKTEEARRRANLIDCNNFSDCLIFPSEDKKLSVEDAEKIREECTLAPVEGDKKVFLVGDFAEANVQTQNKLLKLLEEPPQGVIFLLGATSVFPVLTTVLSRTKKLEILAFSQEETYECLTRIYGDKYEKDALSVVAACSDGNVGKAQDMLEDGHYKSLLEQAFSLCETPISRIPAIVKTVGETKHKKELLSLLRILFRDALIIKTQKGKTANKLLLQAEKERIKNFSSLYTPAALLYAQEAISQAEKQVTFNAVFPQCLEILIAKIREKNNS